MAELIEAALQVVALAVLALGGFAIRRVSDWLRLRADSEVRAYLMQGLERAVEFGRAEARRRLLAPGSAVLREEVPTLQVSLARDYVAERFPDALDRFGLDLAAVEKLVRARLPAPPTPPAH